MNFCGNPVFCPQSLQQKVKFLRQQFPGINGLKETIIVPHYSDSQDKWMIRKQFKKQEVPSAQIHFNGNNHWVFNCQGSLEKEILYADSLTAANTRNSNVQIQIAKVYGHFCSNSSVYAPKVQ